MAIEKNVLMMKQPESIFASTRSEGDCEMRTDVSRTAQATPSSITAKLERIACDYRHDIEVAMNRVNTELENSLTQLVEEFGFHPVYAAVEVIEGDLRIDYGVHTSLYEAFDCVPEPEPDEESENA
jgi:hypothetical protein